MNPVTFKGMTNILQGTPQLEAATKTEIAPLPVCRVENAIISCWKPSADELKVLNAGGVVTLAIFSGSQPPVAVNACEHEPAQDS